VLGPMTGAKKVVICAGLIGIIWVLFGRALDKTAAEGNDSLVTTLQCELSFFTTISLNRELPLRDGMP
jgi:hypothetical protein